MKSILLKLYGGEIFPAEQYYPRTEEYRALRKNYYQHYGAFVEQLKKLDPPLDETFHQIVDEEFDTLPIEMSEMFLDGFRLGARMMIEIYQKDFSDDSR